MVAVDTKEMHEAGWDASYRFDTSLDAPDPLSKSSLIPIDYVCTSESSFSLRHLEVFIAQKGATRAIMHLKIAHNGVSYREAYLGIRILVGTVRFCCHDGMRTSCDAREA